MLSAWDMGEPWTLPVHYRRDGLDIICRLPAWVDPFPGTELAGIVRLLVPASPDEALTWLEYDGEARNLDLPEAVCRGLFPRVLPGGEAGYLLLRIRPRRISIVDGKRGWGFRETLDL